MDETWVKYQDTYGPKVASLTVTVGDDPLKHRVDTSKLWRAETGMPACHRQNYGATLYEALSEARQLCRYNYGPKSVPAQGDWDCPECLALYPLTVDDEEEDDSKDYIWE